MKSALVEKNSTLQRVSELAPSLRQEMLDLMSRNFDGISERQFQEDLQDKDWVILVFFGDLLVGFSTIKAYETSFHGLPVSVICSGDTIMSQEAWGSPVLPRAWINAVNQLRRLYPNGTYYWLLLTSGFRTYRFLPVFWREFYPCYNAQTPGFTADLLKHLARQRWAERFDANLGIVRFAQPQILRQPLRAVPAGRVTDPHVAFFVQRNPGYESGDELVCLTELSSHNLTAAGKRMSQNIQVRSFR